MGNEKSDSAGRGRPSKVARLIDQYELEGVGTKLEAEWTKEEADRRSLRDLADYFNRELLRNALADAGVATIDGEIDNFYRLLTAESASSGDRTRVRRRLEQEGVDIDQLQSDFVSYQAIRTYLQTHRGASYEPDEGERVERLQTAVTRLKNRLTSVTESRIERVNGSEIDIENPNVIANVQVVCTDCGRQFSVKELTENTSCDCRDP